MADELDIAAERIELETQARLKARTDFSKPSLFECKDCGEDIPQARQDLGGVTRCFECQKSFEQAARHTQRRKDGLHVWQKMKK